MVLGPDTPVDLSLVVPVVVGAHIEAELGDRATAQWLADQLTDELCQREPGLRAVVCTDLWYLNDDRLRSRPAVSVGEPELNAYTAFLADKLPDVYSVKDILIVQLDLEGVDLVAACWGRDAIATRQATQVFTERYMSGFCDAVASLMSA
ncbi:MAG: hypothetical protein ACIAQ0_00410 [Phycisphaerales bacterium JB058]|jgi:hypothetical protein